MHNKERQKCQHVKIRFRRGSAPGRTEGVYSIPIPVAGLRGRTSTIVENSYKFCT